MSTNYYLHSTDFAESEHIGASAGTTWTTDTSIGRALPVDGQGRGWTSTAGLLVYLDAQAGRALRFRPWVSDEYGRFCSPAEAADVIRSHRTHGELDRPFI